MPMELYNQHIKLKGKSHTLHKKKFLFPSRTILKANKTVQCIKLKVKICTLNKKLWFDRDKICSRKILIKMCDVSGMDLEIHGQYWGG